MNEIYKQFLDYKRLMEQLQTENSNAPNAFSNIEEKQKFIESLCQSPTEARKHSIEQKEYTLITEHYNNYHIQNVCADCKYYRIRWVDNVCEKHHCIVNPFGICDKFLKNL